MRRTVAVVLAISAALCASAWTAAAQPSDEEQRLVAPVDLQPFGGESASGVARIATAVPREPARIIGVFIGLAIDPGDRTPTTVSLAVSESTCAELADDPDAGALAASAHRFRCPRAGPS